MKLMTQELFEDHCKRCEVPEHDWDALWLYLEHGIQPGSFLEAVLCNDLKESLGRADSINRNALFNIVKLLYNHFPISAWGSPQKVNEWIKSRQKENENGNASND